MTETTANTLLSIFDDHLTPVIGVNRKTDGISYVNKKAGQFFQGTLLNQDFYTIFGSKIKPFANQERFFSPKGVFIIHRLDTSRFSEHVIFFEPVEEEPGKKVMVAGESAASLITHLFRSPLTALFGLAEMIPNATESNRELISSAITDSLLRMSGFLDQLETFTRNEIPDEQQVHLGALLQAFVYKLPAHQRQKIQFTMAAGITEVKTDALFVHDIVTELVKNAFEHGSDVLSPIVLQLSDSKTIYISNMGYLPNQVVDGLFQPFFSTKSQNWGLGLSRCVKKAQSLGATLRLVENSRIKGITFELKLP